MFKKLFQNNYVYFGVVTIAIFSATYLILYIFGLVPKSFYGGSQPILSLNDQILQELGGEVIVDVGTVDDVVDGANGDANFTTPDHITISKIAVDAPILHPASQVVEVLDQALTKGAVYYPGSGSIENGNVLIFGHSTNWQVVQNQAYKTFNDLNKLISGDEIILSAGDRRFAYRVLSVNLLDENNARVDLARERRVLTISTCNTFGQKQERWVVTAEFDREL